MYHFNIATLGCSIAQSSRRGTINGDASFISGLSRQTGEPPNSKRPFPSFSFARQALFWVQVSYLGFQESIELRLRCIRWLKFFTERAFYSDRIRDACVACAECDTKVHRHCFDTHHSCIWASNDQNEVTDQAGGSSSSSGISITE